ncbi:MAG: cytochrome c-type biogenesis protein CcmH/NrfG, partial [Planctomycetota bacterium]
DEATINFLGHSQLGGEKYDLAIAILNFNANAFPSSSNAWGSLGEAHMAKGETAQAIESYGKSLELDPHNANAIERLRRLKQG